MEFKTAYRDQNLFFPILIIAGFFLHSIKPINYYLKIDYLIIPLFIIMFSFGKLTRIKNWSLIIVFIVFALISEFFLLKQFWLWQISGLFFLCFFQQDQSIKDKIGWLNKNFYYFLQLAILAISLINISQYFLSGFSANSSFIFNHTGKEGVTLILLCLITQQCSIVSRNKVINYGPGLLTILYCLLTLNRTVVIILVIISLFQSIFFFREAYKRVIVFVILIITIFLTVFFVKSQSTEGRTFIYKIIILNIKNIGFNGVGGGNFKANFKEWQSNYFKENEYNTGKLIESEQLRANNPTYAFSSFLLLVIEYGVIGLILALLFVGILLYFINTVRQSKSTTQLNVALTVLSLFLFTYYLESFYCSLIVFYFINSNIQDFGQPLRIPFFTKLLINSAFLGLFTYVFVARLSWMKRTEGNIIIEAPDNALIDYKKKILFNYEKEYFEQLFTTYSFFGDAKALEIGREYNHYFPSYELNNALSKLYLQNKDTANFEKSIYSSYYLVPSKIEAKYLLFKFYVEKKDSSKSLIFAKNIIFGNNNKQYSLKGKYYLNDATTYYYNYVRQKKYKYENSD